MSQENEVAAEDFDSIYKFKRPMDFDGEEVKEIDLSEVTNITRSQFRVVLGRHNRNKNKIGNQYWDDPDTLLEFYCIAAGKPFEFFDNISGQDYAILPTTIFGFLAK